MSFSHQKGDCNHSQHQQPKQEYGDLTLQETVELHPQQQQQGFDDLLWDELKNEQSREIQQHNHRLYNSRSTGTAAAAAAAASSGVQNSNRYNPPMYNYQNHHHHYPHHHYPTNHHPSLETFRQSLEPLHENLKPIANALSTAANMASTAAQDQYQRILQTAQERRRTQQEAYAYAGPYRLGAQRGRNSSRRSVEGVAAAASENLEEFGLEVFQSSSVKMVVSRPTHY